MSLAPVSVSSGAKLSDPDALNVLRANCHESPEDILTEESPGLFSDTVAVPSSWFNRLGRGGR
jgi:hypothetical protein